MDCKADVGNNIAKIKKDNIKLLIYSMVFEGEIDIEKDNSSNIADKAKSKYDIDVDRKTISRVINAIKELREAGLII